MPKASHPQERGVESAARPRHPGDANRRNPIIDPEGIAPTARSLQKPILIRHPRLLEHLDQLLAKRPRPVMFLLPRDVIVNRRPRRRTHRDRAIPLLPGESRQAAFLLRESGRRLLQLPHEIRQPMSRAQRNEQMHVIPGPANPVRLGAESLHGAAKVFVHPHANRRCEPGLPPFRRKHDVVMEAQVGGHGAGTPPGCIPFEADRITVVSLRSTTASRRWNPSGITSSRRATIPRSCGSDPSGIVSSRRDGIHRSTGLSRPLGHDTPGTRRVNARSSIPKGSHLTAPSPHHSF